MGKTQKLRWGILGVAISLMLVPTYLVLAWPVLDTSPINNTDISWIRDVPALIVIMLAVVVILVVLIWFITKTLVNQNKVTIPTPAGEPNKVVSMGEMVGMTFNEMLRFMRENAEENRKSRESSDQRSQTILTAFTEQIKEILKDINTHAETNAREISGMKDELIQGRGNQMTAILEVSDRLRESVNNMHTTLSTRNEQMERVNGGIGYLQIGQTKMQKDLETLLQETKGLVQSVGNILEQIERIGESEKSVKDELTALRITMNSIDARLGQMVINVGLKSEDTKTVVPLMKPDAILIEQPDKKEGTDERSTE